MFRLTRTTPFFFVTFLNKKRISIITLKIMTMDNKLPEIQSEFIEPYLVQFMGSMVGFIASACTEEEKIKRGTGWTVRDIKSWVKGVEVFVSNSCGIHARYAMMNECYKFIDMPDDELKELCVKIMYK